MAKKQQIILLHGNGQFKDASLISKGELVIEHGSGVKNVKLHTLDDNSAIATFETKEAILDAVKSLPEITGVSGTYATKEELTNGLAGKADKSTFETYTATTNSAIENKADKSTFETYTATTNNAINGKVDKTSFESYTAATNTTINSKTDKVTFEAYTATTEGNINSKADKSTFESYTAETNSAISNLQTESAKHATKTELTDGLASKVDNSVYNEFTTSVGNTYATKSELANEVKELEEKIDIASGGVSSLNANVSGKTADNKVTVTVSQKAGLLESVTVVGDNIASASDVTTLSGSVADNAANITTLSGLVESLDSEFEGYKTTVLTTYATKSELTETNNTVAANTKAIADETTRATGVESALGTRISEIENLIAADNDDIINKVSEIIEYFADIKEGDTAKQLVEDVASLESNKLDKTDFNAYTATTDASIAELADAIKVTHSESADATKYNVVTGFDVVETEGKYEMSVTTKEVYTTGKVDSLVDAAESNAKSYADGLFQNTIQPSLDTAVQSVVVENTNTNKIVATKEGTVVTLNFDNMVIDGGTY